ncbi:MAG: helix-turn-helix transcriptional regulator [Treponema sp.]|nr:helix-turn-helix transcriptional regulator [Treponema sp.]
MNLAILFTSCLASFAAAVISLLFFLRYKKVFFFDVLLVLVSFFVLSTESYFVTERNAGITNILLLSIIGLFLGVCFSYGIISLGFDLIRVSTNAFVRKLPLFYSILFTAAEIVFAVITKDAKLLSTIINISGIWVPAGISVLLAIIFHKRIDSGVFKKEKWIFIILALINLVFAFFIEEIPFVFIISISLLVFYIFYRFYFAAPVSKTEKSLNSEFVKNFSLTRREQEIILALLEGKSNKELAQALFVSEKTIETHLGNIYKKIGVKNRLELFSRLQNDI